MISFARVFGGPNCHKATGPCLNRLKEAFARNCTGSFCESVDTLLIEIYVSGEVEDYHMVGCAGVRFTSKIRRLTAKVGIGCSAWAKASAEEFAGEVAARVQEALDVASKWCRVRGEVIAETNNLAAAMREFRAYE